MTVKVLDGTLCQHGLCQAPPPGLEGLLLDVEIGEKTFGAGE